MPGRPPGLEMQIVSVQHWFLELLGKGQQRGLQPFLPTSQNCCHISDEVPYLFISWY